MKKQSVVDAYRDIKPDEAAQERMLRNILSASSEIPPAGKDDTMNRKKMKPVVLVALIALMVFLMGCAIVGLRLQDMKIGDWSSHGDTYVDENGVLVTEPSIEKEIISLQGYANSPGMLAAKEWFEFHSAYDPDNSLLNQAEQSGFRAPEAYDAYSVYTQEMIGKIDEIAQKYGLKLAGSIAIVQTNYNHIFFDATGLESLHHENAFTEVEYISGYFYACGNFDFSFLVTLKGNENTWPYEILTSIRYCDKAYLDVIHFTVDDISQIEQWSYRTSDGSEVLFAVSQDSGRIFCDREDAFLSVSFWPEKELASGEVIRMSKEDMELLADTIDFTVKPKQPDMVEVSRQIDEYEAKRLDEIANQQVLSVEEQYQGIIRYRLEELEHPENVYYLKRDVNGDGTVDLLMGSKEKLEVIFTVMDDKDSGTRHITLLPLSEDAYAMWEKDWPDMEINPITTYPMLNGEEQYQAFIRDGLEVMDHTENMYYAMLDVNEDGTVDLLLGSKDQLNVIWTFESSTQQIKFLGYGKDMEELNKAWPDMDIKPITEYPLY